MLVTLVALVVPFGVTPGEPAASATTATEVAGPGGRFHPVTPQRLLDSRTTTGGWTGPLGPGGTGTLAVAGAGGTGVPAGAIAAVFNITVTEPTAASYLTVFPGDEPAPTAANLLFAPGQTVPNHVTVGLGADGTVGFFNQLSAVHVIADLLGWYDDGTDPATGDGFVALVPTRLYDSRDPGAGGPIGPGAHRTIPVGGNHGVPADATAIVANVTATQGTAASWLALTPAGATPTTANLLVAAGQTVPNLVTTALGPDGTLDVTNQQGSIDVIIDVVGYYAPDATAGFHPVSPTRVLDSRDGTGGWTGPLGAASTRPLELPGLPTGASAAALNVTATAATLPTWIRAAPLATTSDTTNLLVAGPTVPNAVTTGLTAQVGHPPALQFTNQQGTVHLVADLAGWFDPLPVPTVELLAGGDLAGLPATAIGMTPTGLARTGNTLVIADAPGITDRFSQERPGMTPRLLRTVDLESGATGVRPEPVSDLGPCGITTITASVDGNLYATDGRIICRLAPDGTVTRIAGNGSIGLGPAPNSVAGWNAPIGPTPSLAVSTDPFWGDRVWFTNPPYAASVLPDGYLQRLAGPDWAPFPMQARSFIDVSAAAISIIGGAGWPSNGTTLANLWSDSRMPNPTRMTLPLVCELPNVTQLEQSGACDRVISLAATPDGGVDLGTETVGWHQSLNGGTGQIDRWTDAPSASAVIHVDTAGVATTIAGIRADSLVRGPAGERYAADRDAGLVRRVDPDGTTTVIAGNGSVGHAGDGGPATVAGLGGRAQHPSALPPGFGFPAIATPFGDSTATLPDGSVLIADTADHRVRRVAPDGTIETVAGTGVAGSSGDGGPATDAQLAFPIGLGVAADGTIYLAEGWPGVEVTGGWSSSRIRRFTIGGTIDTVLDAGGGGPTPSPDNNTTEVAVAPGGTFVTAAPASEQVCCRSFLQRWTADGTLQATYPYPPSGTGSSGDGGPAASATWTEYGAAAFDPAGNLFVVDGDRIRRIDAATDIVTTVAGGGATPIGQTPLVATDGTFGYAATSRDQLPTGLAIVDGDTFFVARGCDLFLADAGSIRRFAGLPWCPVTGIASTDRHVALAVTPTGDLIVDDPLLRRTWRYPGAVPP